MISTWNEGEAVIESIRVWYGSESANGCLVGISIAVPDERDKLRKYLKNK
jgi:hypothetical protein